MKSTFLTALGLLATAAKAAWMCPTDQSCDSTIIEFAYGIQNLLYQYYQSVPVNASFFDGLTPNPYQPISPINQNSASANTVIDFQGLQNQARLSVQALSDFGSKTPKYQIPSCNYALPPPSSANQHIANAFLLEATLCGAFIGLADYIQSPTGAFLMARLAADHGTHAAFLRTYTQATLFSPASVTLVPAFTPDTVLVGGTPKVGSIGAFLNSCVKAPEAPCGGTVTVGNLTASLDGQTEYWNDCYFEGTFPFTE